MILVAGAGAVGASVAYHLALRGARDVVLCDRGEVAGGSTARAMGVVRQQFSTLEEVHLAHESIGFFEELGEPLFSQVGSLFLATSGGGLAELEDRVELLARHGVPAEFVDPSFVEGLAVDDVLGAAFCRTDGVADPGGVTRELVRWAVERGVELRERTPAAELAAEADAVVIAAGPWSAELGRELGVELPLRPLRRQVLETGPLEGLPERLPTVVEVESRFHFRQRGDRLLVAQWDAELPWGFETEVDRSVLGDRLERLARRFPPASGATVEDAWAGLYDMTQDAHAILGRVAEGVYAACGFSGHGLMQAPAAGRLVAEEILDGEPSTDLTPFRLERFEGELGPPETFVL